MVGKAIIIFLLLLVYAPWFDISKTLSSGDWSYLYLENIKEFSFPNAGFLWFVPYYQISAKIFVEYIGLSWNFAEKILWFWPFLILSITSSFYLTRSWIGVLIYTASTYPLMLVGGGQMGVALAYSLAPFVLSGFIKLIDNFTLHTHNFKFPIGLGFVLGIQMMFDPRITYVTLIAVIFYLFLIFIPNANKRNFILNLYVLLIPILTSLVLNSFWIISLLRYGLLPEDIERTSPLGFKFLSFADFSHTFSILHPNWPENIFGKVYFMRPEFILLPVLAYSSLLFFKNQAQKNTKEYWDKCIILFFAILGLTGAFLSKGSNSPFGGVNEFLFRYFPGMSIFRDSTKFYLLTILSYSVLIPFSIYSIQEWVKSKIQIKIKKYIPSLFFIFTFLYLIFLIRPAITGELSGTFKSRNVPNEYLQLKSFVSNQSQSFKTFWVPAKQRFGFYSNNHPMVGAFDFFNTHSVNKIIKEFEKKGTQKILKEDSIKYVIVPYDSENEIFLENRKYSEKEYKKTVDSLKKMPFLTLVKQFGKIMVFEIRL